MNAASTQLDRHRAAEFSLEELVATAARLLRRLAIRPTDGRVAATPDARSVRFYQTAGVIDRPSRYEGRRAVYAFRHLVQLLVVKRLQREGQPLALIQGALHGRTTEELESWLRPDRPERAGEDRLDAPFASSARPPARGSDGPAPRPLIAVELEPGIVVTIDPARVADSRAVASQLTDAFVRIRGRLDGVE